MGNNALSVLYICAAVVVSIAIYTASLEKQTAVSHGLQECVVTSRNATFTVWQKECQK
jgi:hypothetical protein